MLFFRKRRKSPYIEIGDDILKRIEHVHFKDDQMGDFVDTILIMVILEIGNPSMMQFELMKCGFKVSIPTLKKVLNLLVKLGAIDRKFVQPIRPN